MFCNLPKNIFHTWNTWKVVSEGKIGIKASEDAKEFLTVGNYVSQQRTCSYCGLVQLNKSRSYS